MAMLCGSGLLSCADAFRVQTITQRIILQRQTTLYKLQQGRRTQEYFGMALAEDTLFSFATVQAPSEAGNRQLFYIVRESGEAWFDADSGQSSPKALTEYDAVTRVCDTKFSLPNELDSLAWARAFAFVDTHTSDIINQASPTLIQTSKRNRLPNSVSFTIRRTPQAGGMVQYSVRANESLTDLNARKCAFFMQTGRDERFYQGLEQITPKARRE
ncbi:MAG: hypothetical protein EAZ92_07975 [Candidatus Kapaibacterium sp.]|nr:MAG: hypothetical protein EAZ92_07975 [Candidatus Kapabacteria bacterium]